MIKRRDAWQTGFQNGIAVPRGRRNDSQMQPRWAKCRNGEMAWRDLHRLDKEIMLWPIGYLIKYSWRIRQRHVAR